MTIGLVTHRVSHRIHLDDQWPVLRMDLSSEHPTADYINRHPVPYSSKFLVPNLRADP